MRVVAILQARMGSTRLPGKVLLPLAGKPMLQHIIERVSRTARVDKVVIAIPARDAMALWDIDGEVYWPEQFVHDSDLVGRYLSTARKFRADLIVRIPCDNPCVDPEYIDQAVASYVNFPFVYYSNTTDRCQDVLLDGIGAEVLSMNRLQWLDQRTRGNPVWREHPHRYFVDHGLLSLPAADYRLDVNTQADYDFLARLYNHFGHNRFTTSDVVTYLHMTGVTR